MNTFTKVDLPTIDTFISRDIIKKLKPKEKKRQDVLNELQHTEKAHVRNLKVFVIYNHYFLNSMNLDIKLKHS